MGYRCTVDEEVAIPDGREAKTEPGRDMLIDSDGSDGCFAMSSGIRLGSIRFSNILPLSACVIPR